MATRFNRRSQGEPSGSVAALVILLFLLAGIIFYVLLVSPEERAKLLKEEPYTNTVLDVNPGLIEAAEEGEVELFTHDFSGLTVDNSPQLQTKFLRSQVTLSRSSVSNSPAEITFELPVSKDMLADVWLKFYVAEKKGIDGLIVTLNDVEVWSGSPKVGQESQVRLPLDILNQGTNKIQLSAASPGWSFWVTNSYKLSNINLITAQYEFLTAVVQQQFTLTSEEVSGARHAKYTAYIKQLGEPATLTIKINGNIVYSSVPVESFEIDIPVTVLKTGINLIEWSVSRDGTYQIQFGELIIETTEVAKAEEKEYDFTVSSKEWTKIRDALYECELFMKRSGVGLEVEPGVLQARGLVTGRSIDINLNGYLLAYTFTDNELVRDVCDYLKSGANSISLSTDEEDIYIEKLKITIMSKE